MTRKWQERFLSLAQTVAQWSKDPTTKVGAVAVAETKAILETGFNGLPRGVQDLPDRRAERIASLETHIAKLEQERDTLILAVADHVTARSDQADALKLSRDALSGWIGSPNTEQYAALAAIDALKI